MYTLDAASHHPILEESVHRRQDAPEVYVLNGAVYVARTRWMRETQSFLHDQTVASPMPRERAMDVDDELDAHVAEVLLASRHN
jgi:N-acylneuraminate cytidylyltransferase